MDKSPREFAEALYEELRHSSMDAEPTVPMIEAAFTAAVKAERARCAGIVGLSREGVLDNDLRSIISIINYGDSLDEIRADG